MYTIYTFWLYKRSSGIMYRKIHNLQGYDELP